MFVFIENKPKSLNLKTAQKELEEIRNINDELKTKSGIISVLSLLIQEIDQIEKKAKIKIWE